MAIDFTTSRYPPTEKFRRVAFSVDFILQYSVDIDNDICQSLE